jgi:hypothetical protein
MQVHVYTLSFGSLCAHRSVNPRGNASAYTPAKPETVATVADRGISAGFEQDKGATEAGQPYPGM